MSLIEADSMVSSEPELPQTGRVRHILLVTRSYPPLNLVSSQRMYQWAKYWARDGVRVTVLTIKKHPLFGACDLESPSLPNVRIIEVEFLPKLLLRLLERCQRAGPARAGSGGSGQARMKSGRLARLRTWLAQPRLSLRLATGWEFYDLWIPKAVRAGRRIIATDPVEVLVSSYGPPAAHKIAARLKRRFPDLVWVADYRDPWTYHDNLWGGLTGYLERRREHASVGDHADLLVSVSRRLAEQTRRFTAKPVIVVANGFDPEERAEPLAPPAQVPQAVRAAWAPVTLVYTGTLHLDYQDPTPLLRAIGELVRERDPICGELRVLVFGERHGGLQRLIEAEGVAHQVRILGYVERPTALWAQRRASALLLFENQDSAARGLLRAKMFEYLQAGRPILGIGFTATTEVGQILCETGVGRPCGTDVGRIVESLRSLRSHGTWEGFAPAPEVLRRYRRDVQARALLAVMERQLTGRRALP